MVEGERDRDFEKISACVMEVKGKEEGGVYIHVFGD